MQTRVSTKGQVVLPGPIRRKLGIRAGDKLELSLDGERIVLTPHPRPRNKAQIVKDPKTGFIFLDAGPDAPILTNQQIKEMLADFP